MITNVIYAVLVLGVIAFAMGTAGGVLLAKVMNFFSKGDNKINPLIGSAGVSAVPMAARVVPTWPAWSVRRSPRAFCFRSSDRESRSGPHGPIRLQEGFGSPDPLFCARAVASLAFFAIFMKPKTPALL